MTYREYVSLQRDDSRQCTSRQIDIILVLCVLAVFIILSIMACYMIHEKMSEAQASPVTWDRSQRIEMATAVLHESMKRVDDEQRAVEENAALSAWSIEADKAAYRLDQIELNQK